MPALKKCLPPPRFHPPPSPPPRITKKPWCGPQGGRRDTDGGVLSAAGGAYCPFLEPSPSAGGGVPDADARPPVVVLGRTLSRTEPWFGVHYALEPLAPELLQRWASPALPWVTDGTLHLPRPNHLLPTRLEVLPFPAELVVPTPGTASPADVARLRSIVPQLLPCGGARCRVWHKRDCHFLVPKASAKFAVRTQEVWMCLGRLGCHCHTLPVSVGWGLVGLWLV